MRLVKSDCTIPKIEARDLVAPKRTVAFGGRDLPDADGPRFVALNGSFRTENRALIGQGRGRYRNFGSLTDLGTSLAQYFAGGNLKRADSALNCSGTPNSSDCNATVPCQAVGTLTLE
jgi:hypothetical protein